LAPAGAGFKCVVRHSVTTSVGASERRSEGKMAYPFRSEGIFGRPTSHRKVRLTTALKDRLARLLRRSRTDRQLAERVRLVFDSLEPRLLLNGDLTVNLSTD